MRSKAHIQSHPLHPILVAFPIAFYTATLLCDCLALFLHKTSLQTTGWFLHRAAIGSAVVAAIPGIIDYFGTIPPESSAKQRATKHGLINVTALLLFCGAAYCKINGIGWKAPVSLEVLGVALTMVAGWLGGTLVYRNQIGVDIRYSDAGKWNELYISENNGPFEVGNVKELEVNQMKLIHFRNKRIVVARTEDGFVAFDDRCTHKGGSLAGGSMICGTVQCPWHGSQFAVTTGEVKAGPAKKNIKAYNVSEEGGKIFLSIS